MEKKAAFTGPSAMSHMHQSSGPTPDPSLNELITSLSVTDRPDLMIFRKFSEAGKNMPKLRKKQKGSSKQDAEDVNPGLTHSNNIIAPLSCLWISRHIVNCNFL